MSVLFSDFSSRPGEELLELLWDNTGPALLRTAPFQPFTCSAAGSTRAHELRNNNVKRHAAMDDHIVGLGGRGGIPVVNSDDDDDAVPWLHCPVMDDGGDSDTAPLPPEYSAGLFPGYPAAAVAVPDPTPPPADIAPPPQTSSGVGGVSAPTQPLPGEGVMNFTFFSRPLQRPQPQPPSTPLESAVVQQTAASRLRSTPLFSDQRMAWLQPPPNKAPHHHQAAPATDQHHGHHHVVELEAAAAATVTQHQHHQHRSLQLQPQQPRDARRAPPPDAAAVTTSSVCSGNGDHRSNSHSHQHRRSSGSGHQQQPTAECSVSQDEDMDDEPVGAARRSAARGTKRTRTAEVHNLSERRRRDRINEKMRALQELIPNCNKIDKASMLEEAIEYLKTLQLQVQMMSMGTAAAGMCVPSPAAMLMQMQMASPFPPHLGMGMGMGFGMGFDMLPRFAAAAAQFPCAAMMPAGAPPPHAMAMPHAAAMFGMPSPAAMPFPYVNGVAAPAEQREGAVGPVPPPGGGGAGAGDQTPVTVASQGDQKLQQT
ncbi:hypothetical protein PR202_gb24946 [Eleusine coracana subsp. coracana]|uniref:BHLH domain-containing protein n=1 Tax=Eleusine coracana subsp. coracana TaxID=191504 RepID=A0AAV5FMS8_ELECO|nr:hypothetical protein PR202_gb24946 [Eleusine coracana subsp. coracana]